MTNQKKEVSEFLRTHIIICGVPEYKEPIQNAILEHLSDEKKEA